MSSTSAISQLGDSRTPRPSRTKLEGRTQHFSITVIDRKPAISSLFEEVVVMVSVGDRGQRDTEVARRGVMKKAACRL